MGSALNNLHGSWSRHVRNSAAPCSTESNAVSLQSNTANGEIVDEPQDFASVTRSRHQCPNNSLAEGSDPPGRYGILPIL